MKCKRSKQTYLTVFLLTSLSFSILSFLIPKAEAQVTTLASTELLNFYSMTTAEKTTFVNLLDDQNITHFILRAMAMYEWDDTSWATIDSRIGEAEEFIIIANGLGINVSYDLHTWYTTWDNYFDDSASGHDANRVIYIDYVEHVLTKFEDDGANVYSFMVLNEPQAQTASTDENNFILNIISAANAVTDKPISVRFMGGYSPSTGHYSSSIDVACDYICRNTYWDARYPTTTVYGCSEAKLLAAIAYAHSNSKEFWCTEFGKAAGSSPYENQRSYVEAWVEWANDHDADRIYCWASQPEAGSSESYNIFTGYTPRPAFYELTNEAEEEPPAGDNVVTLNHPNNLQEFDYFNIYFNYTATFYQGSITNSSLWANLSGTWQRLGWNTTTITNATMHTINYTFVAETTYIWNIQVFNSTTAHWATTNRTFTIETTPPPDDPPTYSTYSVSTTTNGTLAFFYCEWYDDISLSYGVISHNITGSWTNGTTKAMFTPHLTYSDSATLPTSIGIIVGYRFYANDTSNQWNVTSIYTLTTTPAPTFEEHTSEAPSGAIVYSAGFSLYFLTGSSFALQNTIGSKVTVTITSGNLIGIGILLAMTSSGGLFQFSTFTSANLKINYTSTTLNVGGDLGNPTRAISSGSTITVQTGNVVTMSWSSYTFIFHGPYNETIGTRINGTVEVRAYFTDGTPTETFTVNGTYVYVTTQRLEHFQFVLPSGTIREYWVTPNEYSSDIWLFDEETITYTVAFLDLGGVLKTYPYVEAKRYVNGTLFTVEKRKVDLENKVVFNLKQDTRYTIMISGEGVSYTFGDLTFTSVTAISLTLKAVDFPKATLFLYKYVRIYGERALGTPNGTISIIYQDTLNKTTSVQIWINYKNGTNIVYTTITTNSFVYTWSSASNDTDYAVVLGITHEIYGYYGWKQYFPRGMSEMPWGMAWFGTLPFDTAYILPALLIVFVGACFSVLNAYIGAFMMVVIATLESYIGWLPIPASVIVVAFTFAIIMGIIYAKRKIQS